MRLYHESTDVPRGWLEDLSRASVFNTKYSKYFCNWASCTAPSPILLKFLVINPIAERRSREVGHGRFNRDLHRDQLDSPHVAVQNATRDPQQGRRQLSTKSAHQAPSPQRPRWGKIRGISIVVEG